MPLIPRSDMGFEDIDRETESWQVIFRAVNDNYDKVVWRVENDGQRRIVERIVVTVSETRYYELHEPHVTDVNSLVIYIDGVRQFEGRDYEETGDFGFTLIRDSPVEYGTVIEAVYTSQYGTTPECDLPDSVLEEYRSASKGFRSPKDRVRDSVEGMGNTLFREYREAETAADVYLSGMDEAGKVTEYLETFHDDSIAPGDYYVTPILGVDGNIRWTKSMDTIRRPKGRTFIHRASVDENAIFVGNGEESLPDQVVGEGVVVSDAENGPHYSQLLSMDEGGVGEDVSETSRTTGLLVLGDDSEPEDGRTGIISKSGRGFVSDTLPIEYGGTGTRNLAAAIDGYTVPVGRTMNLDVLSTVSYNKVMSDLKSYRKYLGREFSVPTTNPAYGDIPFTVIGIGREVGFGDDRPKFTLMASHPIVTYPLCLSSGESHYATYNELDGLFASLDSIYAMISDSVRSKILIPAEIPLDCIYDDCGSVRNRVATMNPVDTEFGSEVGDVHGKRLWIMSLADADNGFEDLVIPNRFYDWFSMFATDRIIETVAGFDGMWTRSQARSEAGPMYYAIFSDGTVRPESVETGLGIAPMICV